MNRIGVVGSNTNNIRLRDYIRRWLRDQLRYREAATIDGTTTREDLCFLLGIDPNTPMKRIREYCGIPYIMLGGVGGSRTRRGSTLIDVDTMEEIYLSSINSLRRYLDCGVDTATLSPIIRRGGCTIRVMGREKYLIPNDRPIDLSQLQPCDNTCLRARLRLRTRGNDVVSRGLREILHMLGLPNDTEADCFNHSRILERICKHIGEDFHPIERGYIDSTPLKTTLYNHRRVLEFDSTLKASRYLRVRNKTLITLCERGEPCPYLGEDYYIEIHRGD